MGGWCLGGIRQVLDRVGSCIGPFSFFLFLSSFFLFTLQPAVSAAGVWGAGSKRMDLSHIFAIVEGYGWFFDTKPWSMTQVLESFSIVGPVLRSELSDCDPSHLWLVLVCHG